MEFFQLFSATWCLLIFHHTEKLNRFQGDDRPHNSIPLDEMPMAGQNRQAHSQAHQVSSWKREADRYSCPCSCKLWGLETQLLCWEGVKELVSCWTSPFIFPLLMLCFFYLVFTTSASRPFSFFLPSTAS
jgi:hypothetical protein